MALIDSYKHKGLRKKLVEILRKKGVEEKILTAVEAVPRHFFLDKAFEEQAYLDKALPIDADQTISQPYTVAFQSSLLEIKKRDKVLEIGTGSGYQATILRELGARVYSIERQEKLYHKTKKKLVEMGYHLIRLYLKDGMKGLPEFAPFDKIIVTAGATEVPKALLDQLAIGGILVIPVGDNQGQKMLRIIRVSEKEYVKKTFHNFRFVPLLKGVNYEA